jgi:hypothetical protein
MNILVLVHPGLLGEGRPQLVAPVLVARNEVGGHWHPVELGAQGAVFLLGPDLGEAPDDEHEVGAGKGGRPGRHRPPARAARGCRRCRGRAGPAAGCARPLHRGPIATSKPSRGWPRLAIHASLKP